MINRELENLAGPEKTAFLPRFFLAFPGGYGVGDLFIGLAVPEQRKSPAATTGEFPRLNSRCCLTTPATKAA